MAHSEDTIRDIDEIAEIIGEEKARTLAERLGGVSQYIGLKAPEPRIADAVGADAAEAIREYFGGATVYIARALAADAATARRTRSDIVRLYHEGVDITDIACETRRSVRQVYRVLRAAGAGPRRTPNRRVRELRRRNEEIRRRFEAGETVEQIATEIGRSKALVQGALRKTELASCAVPEMDHARYRGSASRR